jgi:hypothetical protein
MTPGSRPTLRRAVGLTALLAGVGATTLGVSAPANASVTVSNIDTPADGTSYLVTDDSPGTIVTVAGTSNGSTGDLLDVRCYIRADTWTIVATNVPVQANGTFSTTMGTSDPWGTCVLRAVPAGWPSGHSTTSFTGPRVTSEWLASYKINTGPNAGTTIDYYAAFQSPRAFNDYGSVTAGGLYNSRLTYATGYSSNRLWNQNAALTRNEDGVRSFLKVDGRNAFGPYSAAALYAEAVDASGLPGLSYSAGKDATTGVTTIHETNPIVVCPSETFPPTSASCPQFRTAGVRLERTIVTDDGGRQVHFTDVWRSTDGRAHTVSAHYDQSVQGADPTVGTLSVGLKLPWLSTAYQTFAGDVAHPGTTKVPGTIFVRSDNTAPDGSTAHPRGAITFDTAPGQVRRKFNSNFTLRDEGIAVPAGGTRTVRHDYVIGTSESEIAAKAAASRVRLNPYRPDGLIRKGTASYVGNNVYNTTGTGQAVTARKKRGKKATFYVRVQNDGTVTDSFRVKGAGAKKGFAVSYLSGTRDVTSAVTHGTFTVKGLAPGQARVIRLVVKVKAGARLGVLRSWPVTATSTHATTRTDLVRAGVKVARH